MKAFHPWTLLMAGCASSMLVSCDKAKELTDAGLRKIDALTGRTEAGKGGAAAPVPKPSAIPKDDGRVAEVWQKDIDRTADGVVFRKDLAFPGKLVVKTTTEEDWHLRVALESAPGGGGKPLHGVRSSVEEVALEGDQVRHRVVSADWSPQTTPQPAASGKSAPPPVAAKPKAAPAPAPQTAEAAWAPSSGANVRSELTLARRPAGWEVTGRPHDFQAAFAASQLAEVAGLVPSAYAAAPRPLWFGKHRLKPGTTIAVPESQLSMLMDGKSLQGSLTLTFEEVEGVGGHPCGRFAIRGTVRRGGIPTTLDAYQHESLTIESGKIWLSVVQPVILKSDWHAIVTRQLAGVQLQGSLRRQVVRSWSPSPQ